MAGREVNGYDILPGMKTDGYKSSPAPALLNQRRWLR
jgi:hypothetical protein